MNSPHALRRPRGGPRPWLAVLLVGLVIVPASPAQEPDKAAGKAVDDTAKTKATDSPAIAPAVEEPQIVHPEPELWADPNRLDLIDVDSFPEISGPVLTPTDEKRFQAMAQGQPGLDPSLIAKYVAHHAAELTEHDNLQALINPEPSPRGARGNAAKVMEEAATALLAPLLPPVTARTAPFHRAYVAALLSQAPKLLKGHLHTRTFFMVVLSRCRAPEAIPVLNAQLIDPDQPLMVKLLAAVGLTNITENGRRPLDANNQAIPAAQALTQFLTENPDAFWPAKCRALEALGSLRTATANVLGGVAEFTAQPFQILANPEEKPEVRAWAGWALGMINVPVQIQRFNYELIAFEIGQAAVAIGDQILEIPVPKAKPTQNLRIVERLSGPLLRLLAAFVGDPDLRNSGLSQARGTSASSAQSMIRGVEQRIRALATSALAYSKAVGSQVPGARDRFADDVKELKSFLSKNMPKDNALYPGGPTVEPPAAEKKGPQAKKDTTGAASG